MNLQCDELSLNNDLNFYWTINKLVDIFGVTFQRSLDNFCFIQTSTGNLTLAENTLEFGQYSLTAYVASKQIPGLYRQLDAILSIGAGPIIAKISGDKEVNLNWNDTYQLDYSGSYDTEAPNLNNLYIDIICTKDRYNETEHDIGDDIQTQIEGKAYDYESIGIQMVFKSGKSRFFEKDCFHTSNPSYTESVVQFDQNNRVFSVKMVELNLNESSLTPIIFRIVIYDSSRMAQAQQKVALNESNSFLARPSNDLDEMAKQLDKLDELANANPSKALEYVSNFADALNTIGGTGGSSHENQTTTAAAAQAALDSKVTGMRGKMLGTMGKIVDGVDDVSSMTKAASATDTVTSNPDQMPTSNQDVGGNVISKIGEKAKNFQNLDPETAGNLATVVLGAGSNLFGAAEKGLPPSSNNRSSVDLTDEIVTEEPAEEATTTPPPPAKIAAPLIFYQCDECEDFPEERFELQNKEEEEKKEKEKEAKIKTADIAEKSLQGIVGVASAVAGSLNDTNNSTTISSKSLSLSVAKRSPNDTGEATLGGDSSGTSISMPSLGDVLPGGESGKSVGTKLLVSKNNPYQSASGNAGVQGSIVSLELTDESGVEIPVNNTNKPFVISIPVAGAAGDAVQESVNYVGSRIFKTYIESNGTAVSMVLKPYVLGHYYGVYVYHSPNKSINVIPGEDNYHFYYTIPTNISFEGHELEDDLRHTVFVGGNDTMGAGFYYFAIKLLRNNQSNETEPVNGTSLSYFSMRLFSSSCKYWNKKTKDWATDGCEVGRKTTFNMTECFCYHLTTFGSDFYVPPNTIDFANVWAKFKNLSENAAVFATIVSILGLYVLVGIWARWMDKRDMVKWGAIPLIDNLPNDNYYYLISVQTGVGKDTATDSNVGFVVVGEYADSGVRKLNDGKRKGFTSGSVLNFIMSTEEPLGPLTYIRIWHDNSGKGRLASWYLNMVNILDIETNEKYQFVCDNWLAVEKGDGQIDRMLPVASRKDLTSFKHLFAQSVKKKFTDGHLWFSVFSRPTKSYFTRLQRISCCLSLLFCTMIANAMFYKAEDKLQTKTAVKLGPISFTLSQLFTSIISTLIVVPVNVLVVSIFRKAKLKHSGIIPTRSHYVAKQQHWRKVGNHEIFGENARKKSLWQKLKECCCCCKSKPSHIEYKRDEELEKRNKKQGRTLPHWTIYIGWTLCILSIIVPAFFCILYSMEWGKDRSNAWLASMMLSFFQSVLVVDPVKVFIVTAIITCILRKPDDDDESTVIDSGDPFYNAIANKDEEFLNASTSVSQINIQEALQARRTKLTQLKTMDPEELARIREHRIKEIKMGEILREIASYFCFLVVLLFLCHQARHTNSYLMYENMKKLFIENPVQGFEDIKSRPDFWTYLEDVFLPNLYAPIWYNNKTLTWREKLTLSNRYSIRVGAPRLRQLRVKNPSCRVSPFFRNVISGCRSNYDWLSDDTKSYNEGWVKRNDSVEVVDENAPAPESETTSKDKKKKKCKTAWCYQNSLSTKSVPIMATYATYKGGGYVVTLGRTLQKSLDMMADLKAKGWVDQMTRAIFFEFTVYNPNVNLFSSVTLVIEYLATGASITFENMKVFRLYNYVGSFGVVVLVFQITYVIFLVYFVITEVLKVKSQGRAYFGEFWNLNEMVMVIFSIVAIAMYAMKNIFTTLAMKAVRESELGEFVNFNTISLWDDTYNTILAVVSFCATLKFLKLLRFNKRIGMLSATLKYATPDLKSFSFTLSIFMLAYTHFGYLLFGSILTKYRNFLTSLESVFLLLLGQFNFDEMLAVSTFLGTFYFMTFIFLVFIGLMAIFMTILNEAFEQVKSDLENQGDDHEMVEFILTSFKKVVGLEKKKKPEEEEGGEGGEKGEQKGDENDDEKSNKKQLQYSSSVSMISIRQTTNNKVAPTESKSDISLY